MKTFAKNRRGKLLIVAIVIQLMLSICAFAVPAYAGTICGSNPSVKTSIDLGCTGKVHNPIMDMVFGIIRFLSDGVGLIVVGSIIVAGIQYSSAHGDPQASANARNRIRSSVFALLLYIFAYAILNYVIPKGFFQ